jgi:hypothetical protein
MLALVVISLVAFGYIDIRSRTTRAWRETQNLEASIHAGEQENADLETILAQQTSSEVMAKRASNEGYVPVMPSDITYVFVPGYTTREAIDLSSARPQPIVHITPSAYTESLFDWFAERLQSTAPLVGGQP